MNQSSAACTSCRSHRAALVAALIAIAVALLLLIPSTVHAATISFVNNSKSCGTVSKASVTIAAGKKIGSLEAKATPKSGYRFDGWYLGGTKIGSSLKNQTVKGDASYLAHFTKTRVTSQNHSGKTALDTMGLIVDNECIIKKNGQEGVYVRNKDGDTYFRPIKVKITDGKQSVIYESIYINDKYEQVETVRVYQEVLRNPQEALEKDLADD